MHDAIHLNNFFSLHLYASSFPLLFHIFFGTDRMSSIDGDWFRDDWNKAGIGLSLKIEKVLHKEKSAYQEIMVLKR